VLQLLKDNKVTAVALSVVILLGGTATITLPADKKVAQLETRVAQTLDEFDRRMMRQDIERAGDEVE
jgi:IS5 family transposase